MIRRIPATLTRKGLEHFVQSVAKTRFVLPFAKKPEVCDCQILRIIDKDANQTEIIGLVSIRPRKAALDVIERLNRSQIKGHAVKAREFFTRAYQRDRRDLLTNKNQPPPDKDRRRGDRRRNVVIEKVTTRRVEVAY